MLLHETETTENTSPSRVDVENADQLNSSLACWRKGKKRKKNPVATELHFYPLYFTLLRRVRPRDDLDEGQRVDDARETGPGKILEQKPSLYDHRCAVDRHNSNSKIPDYDQEADE